MENNKKEININLEEKNIELIMKLIFVSILISVFIVIIYEHFGAVYVYNPPKISEEPKLSEEQLEQSQIMKELEYERAFWRKELQNEENISKARFIKKYFKEKNGWLYSKISGMAINLKTGNKEFTKSIIDNIYANRNREPIRDIFGGTSGFSQSIGESYSYLLVNDKPSGNGEYLFIPYSEKSNNNKNWEYGYFKRNLPDKHYAAYLTFQEGDNDTYYLAKLMGLYIPAAFELDYSLLIILFVIIFFILFIRAKFFEKYKVNVNIK